MNNVAVEAIFDTSPFVSSSQEELRCRKTASCYSRLYILLKQEHDSAEHHDDHGDHGHGHHHKPYDWRDDHSKNLDFEENILFRGTPDPREYEYPFQADPVAWVYSHPDNYNQKNLTQILTAVKHVQPIENEMRVYCQ